MHIICFDLFLRKCKKRGIKKSVCVYVCVRAPAHVKSQLGIFKKEEKFEFFL